MADLQKGTIKILLIHRPDYDDWTFPKGKCDEGEDFLACAIREVVEETNVVGAVGSELPSTRYVDGRGRDKIVRYWAMKYLSGDFEPNDEVDQIKWVKLGDVAAMLTYERDAAVIAGFHEVF
ncbi:MAG: NUDIX hydrolase [Acidimicrobiales bacterium]